MMEEQLCKRFKTEEDPHIREMIWKELRERLSSLKGKLRTQQRERENLRQEVIAVCPDSQKIQSQMPGHSSSKLLCDNTEIESDRVVLSEAKKVIISLSKEVDELHTELDTYHQAERKDVMESLLDSTDVKGQYKKIEMLSNMVVEQDNTIVRLKGEIKRSQKQNVAIRRTDVNSILDRIQSRFPKHKRQADIEDEDVAKAMKKHTNTLLNDIETIEKSSGMFKKRLGHVGDRVTQLEKERGVLMEILGVKPSSKDTALQDVLCDRLKEAEEEKKALEEEMESLTKRMDQLADENRSLCTKMVEKMALNGETANGRRLSTDRKLSCPGSLVYAKVDTGLGSPKTALRRVSLSACITPSPPKSSRTVKPASGKARRSSLVGW